MTVAAILARKDGKLVSAGCQTPVHEAVRLLTENRIGALPVVHNGCVVGIMSERNIGMVSIGDLVAHRIARIEEDAAAMRSYIQNT